MRVAALHGRDWTELGIVGRADLGDRVALANSRGGVAKRYAYTDPNEDVVAAAELDDGRLVLVCADGHNGEPASRAAVDAVLACAQTLDGPEALLDAFAAANDAVLAQAAGPRNRTTLIVVVADDRAVHWAAIGDSALVHLTPGRAPIRLGAPRMHFVGYPMSRLELHDRLPRGTAPRERDDAWALVTDGLEEFLPAGRPVEEVVAELAARTTSARELADALVEAAFAAGAGDNVAAIVLR